jgi:hypothetical protein
MELFLDFFSEKLDLPCDLFDFGNKKELFLPLPPPEMLLSLR